MCAEPRDGFAGEELDDAVGGHRRTQADVLLERSAGNKGPKLFEHAPEPHPALDIERCLDPVASTVRLGRG